jgi:hypothetical protein
LIIRDWIVDLVARSPKIGLDGEEFVVDHSSVGGHDAHQKEQVPYFDDVFTEFALSQFICKDH